MIIYIDSEYKCHISNDGTMTAVDVDFFDGKCDVFIEGYRYIPFGKSWECPDGTIFTGKMVSPWKDYNELNEAQRTYERQKLAMYEEALKIMGVEV